ncbi:MAG: phosphopantothenate/pantothenate synthetase [Candidatus Altiarchaeota archaeon]|nr:phosphopantothenate/pantothenate synthetase [Candidatus Altiarchaeota archaeon]
MDIPRSHPRYESLMQRHRIEEGVKQGYVTLTGMIAQGRGECFDYLLGERTSEWAKEAERMAVALLLQAKNPVISINGNVAALCAQETVDLVKSLKAKIEVNLFYWTREREKKIKAILTEKGADEVFGTDDGYRVKIPDISSRRGLVDKRGIYASDVVLVPLEDGDRTEMLVAMGKKVIAIDLNPLSRTSRKATVSIVDNVARAIPNMIGLVAELKEKREECLRLVRNFENKRVLEGSIKQIKLNLDGLSF